MQLRQTLAIGILAASLGAALPAAQAQDQFFPVLSYRVGDYAAGGSGFFGGMIDYWNLVNAKGGVNGVKITYEECETGYVPARAVGECYERLKKKHGGASAVEPLATGGAYALLDRVPGDKIPLTTVGYGRADAADGKDLSLGVSPDHHLLEPGLGHDQIPGYQGGRGRQAQGQNHRPPVPRLRLRQGADPGTRGLCQADRLQPGENTDPAGFRHRAGRAVGGNPPAPIPTT